MSVVNRLRAFRAAYVNARRFGRRLADRANAGGPDAGAFALAATLAYARAARVRDVAERRYGR